jgi:hypothetical protein
VPEPTTTRSNTCDIMPHRPGRVRKRYRRA